MDLKKYFVLTGMLGIGYLAYSYLTKATAARGKKIPLETTKKILQEIKHQILIVCLTFSDSISKHLSKQVPKQQHEKLMNYFRGEMVKIYQQKEQLIIAKYDVNKVDYAESLKYYGLKDEGVKKQQTELYDMLERAVKGRTPDLTVPQAATNKFSLPILKEIYREMCLKIGILVKDQLIRCKREDPSFDSKNDACFKKAIKQISIYDVKVKFFIEKGLNPAWGCPNQIFFKLMETQKLKNPEFKRQMVAIQKGYEQIIEKVSNNPEQFKNPQLAALMDDGVLEIGNNIKPVPQVKMQPIVQKPKMFTQPPRPVFQQKKPVDQDEFDLDKLMAQQLMNRATQKIEEKPASQEKILQERKDEILEAQKIIETSIQKHQQQQEAQIGQEVKDATQNSAQQDKDQLDRLHFENQLKRQELENEERRLHEFRKAQLELAAALEADVDHRKRAQDAAQGQDVPVPIQQNDQVNKVQVIAGQTVSAEEASKAKEEQSLQKESDEPSAWPAKEEEASQALQEPRQVSSQQQSDLKEEQ